MYPTDMMHNVVGHTCVYWSVINGTTRVLVGNVVLNFSALVQSVLLHYTPFTVGAKNGVKMIKICSKYGRYFLERNVNFFIDRYRICAGTSSPFSPGSRSMRTRFKCSLNYGV